MATAEPTERRKIAHRYLRAAIELALAEADAGARRRPPEPFPPELRPFLRSGRVPTAALGRLRRAIESDDSFRRRVAAIADVAGPSAADPIGAEWLRRPDGWEKRLQVLVGAAEDEGERADQEAALRRAERRRQAAEEAADRARADVVALRTRVDELEAVLEEERVQRRRADDAARQLTGQLTDARRAERHANDRADAVQARFSAVEADRAEARAAIATAEAQRDALLAGRAERMGAPGLGVTQITELRSLAESARRVAERLTGLVDVTPGRRTAVALRGGVAGDSTRAVEHLLRVPDALFVVDGYNVAKAAWPDAELEQQRLRALDLVDDLARRFGTEVTVVFDGADVVGAHARRRRLSRVVFSPAGTPADDVIRSTVAATPHDRPVVVVTSDREVRRSVAAMGANLVSSDTFLSFAAARR
ncbi:MAG: NYN domain-containing protein [Ilumatobacteraceae bacterium]